MLGYTQFKSSNTRINILIQFFWAQEKYEFKSESLANYYIPINSFYRNIFLPIFTYLSSQYSDRVAWFFDDNTFNTISPPFSSPELI